MNKHYLLLLTLALFSLPLVASAAFNDVQFPQDTSIYLPTPDLYLTIEAGARVASLTTNPTNLQIGLEPGSYIKIVSPGKKLLVNSLVTTDCETSQSSITINYTTGSVINLTVTPEGICSPGGGIGGAPPPAPAAAPPEEEAPGEEVPENGGSEEGAAPPEGGTGQGMTAAQIRTMIAGVQQQIVNLLQQLIQLIQQQINQLSGGL